MKTKYLTKPEREYKAHLELELAVEKIEKKFKVWIDYNVLDIVANK